MNQKSALLLIDIQDGLDELDYYGGERNNPDAEKNCRRILEVFRTNNWPIIHVQHDSSHPDSPLHPNHLGNKIKDIVAPLSNERVIRKNVNSAFIGTDLQKLLDKQRIQHLYVVGLTTEHCVSTTVRMAANLGYQVTLATDAIAAFNKTGSNGEEYSAEMIHQTTLATLKDEFANLKSTEAIVQSIERSSS